MPDRWIPQELAERITAHAVKVVAADLAPYPSKSRELLLTSLKYDHRRIRERSDD